MYTLQQVKKVWEEAVKNPHRDFEDVRSELLDSEAYMDDIMIVVDAWRKYECLPKFRKIDATIRKTISAAIKAYSIEECVLAIDRYAEVLADSSYYMSYVWDIRKFFKQGNAAPDFMSNGVKWINYQKETKEKRILWSSFTGDHPRRTAMLKELRNTINRFREKRKQSLSTTSISTLTEESLSHFVNMDTIEAYPTMFLKVASNHNIVVDKILTAPASNKHFKGVFSDCHIVTKDGTLIQKYDVEKAFKALNLD